MDRGDARYLLFAQAMEAKGSFLAFLLLLGSAFVGRLFDAGYLRSSVIAGSILLIFTTLMTSLSTEWYGLFLYVPLVIY